MGFESIAMGILVLFALAVLYFNLYAGLALLAVVLLASIKVVNQWEKGVILTLGNYSYTLSSGLHLVVPVVQNMIKVDLRIKTVDIPKQEVMTKDNVPANVNAVVYFKVERPEDAVLKIEDYTYAVAQYSQTALRDVIGNTNLDQVLTDREVIAEEIKKIVDKATQEWGVDITAIKMQDIELPGDMKRAMARQAEAEREKRATVTLSEGEVIASKNLAQAAKTLSTSDGGLHLRTLQTISDVSADQSNTIVFVTPVEVLEAFKKWAGKH